MGLKRSDGGSTVLCSHPLRDERNFNCCHPKYRVGDEGTVGWAGGFEQDGGKFRHSGLMYIESFQLPLVGTNEGAGGGTDGGGGLGPCWFRTDDHRRTSGLDVGGMGCPLLWCEHVDEEVIGTVGVTVGH